MRKKSDSAVRLQISLIAAGQVFPGVPFELPKEALAALQAPTGTAKVQAPGSTPRQRFALRRWPGVWQVFFEWEEGFFADTAGVLMIEHLLKHPGEPIHPVVLLARLQGEEPVQQRSAALDDAEATRHYLREMERLRGVIEQEKTPSAKRRVAEEELAQLEEAKAYTHHRTFDNAARVVKSVRQAIYRVIELLEEAPDERVGPSQVLVDFAAHLRRHLLDASQPGLVPAGHLV